MTAQANLNQQTTVVSDVDRERLSNLLKGLQETDQFSYTTQLGPVYGFPVSGKGWSACLDVIEDSILNPSEDRPNANLDNLDSLVNRVIISASHFYSIDSITPTDPQKRALDHLVVSAPTEKNLADIYPKKKYVGEVNTSTVYPGTYLTQTKIMGDGIAFIFSYIYNEAPRMLGTALTHTLSYQFFTIAFIPNDYSRIEFRVPKTIPKRHLAKAMLGVKNALNYIFEQAQVNLNKTSLNFYKAISKLHADSTYGRAVHIVYNGTNTGSDVKFTCRTNPAYNARELEVNDKSNNNDSFECRAIAVRLDSQNASGIVRTEVGLEPNKKQWLDDAICPEFFIENPADTASLNSIINHVINESK
ncbi:hypothetical protein [Mixta hanseatica]|uniref:Uncharacterized protein n=1 Tax=Mixta hanseatica TaxID=2872648 RepID=A0ABY4R8H6_9GAMM|nr:hypothetical protein [Mixta hanseatica]UQY43282.1 hypothetical protein K6958_15505 [Mixta hanseatica]